MCKHLKGRSGLCRRFRLGCEKRNRAAGLLNSFNGGSGCTSDCEVNLSREFTLGQQPHTMLAKGEFTRSEEHTSELQSLMRISYAVFCLKKKIKRDNHIHDVDAERNCICRTIRRIRNNNAVKSN